MSASTLREAAVQIRKDQAIEEDLGHIGTREYVTWLAVADWLEAEAESTEATHYVDHPAVAVAFVYLYGGAT